MFYVFLDDSKIVYNVSWDDTWKLVWPRVDDLKLKLVSGQQNAETSDKSGNEILILRTDWELEKNDWFRVTTCVYDPAYTPICESRLEASPEFTIAQFELCSVQVDVVKILNSFNGSTFENPYYVVKATGSYIINTMAQKPVNPRSKCYPRVELGEVN